MIIIVTTCRFIVIVNAKKILLGNLLLPLQTMCVIDKWKHLFDLVKKMDISLCVLIEDI